MSPICLHQHHLGESEDAETPVKHKITQVEQLIDPEGKSDFRADKSLKQLFFDHTVLVSVKS
jgi:hypothetical protein